MSSFEIYLFILKIFARLRIVESASGILSGNLTSERVIYISKFDCFCNEHFCYLANKSKQLNLFKLKQKICFHHKDFMVEKIFSRFKVLDLFVLTWFLSLSFLSFFGPAHKESFMYYAYYWLNWGSRVVEQSRALARLPTLDQEVGSSNNDINFLSSKLL